MYQYQGFEVYFFQKEQTKQKQKQKQTNKNNLYIVLNNLIVCNLLQPYCDIVLNCFYFANSKNGLVPNDFFMKSMGYHYFYMRYVKIVIEFVCLLIKR